jgi:anti-anti-sigma factor
MEAAYNPNRPWGRLGYAEPDEVPAGRQVYADKQLVVLRTLHPEGIRFAGEIDATNSNAVSSSIRRAFGAAQDLHVDVSRLLFCDISGIRAFVLAAEALVGGRRLLLCGMPARLETVIKVVGWNRMPALVVCQCGNE